MTCAEADRVSYEAILSEQREASVALADLMAEEIFSFGGAGSASVSNGPSGVGSAAARTPIECQHG